MLLRIIVLKLNNFIENASKYHPLKEITGEHLLNIHHRKHCDRQLKWITYLVKMCASLHSNISLPCGLKGRGTPDKPIVSCTTKSSTHLQESELWIAHLDHRES